jgi:hypothetical protein
VAERVDVLVVDGVDVADVVVAQGVALAFERLERVLISANSCTDPRQTPEPGVRACRGELVGARLAARAVAVEVRGVGFELVAQRQQRAGI